MLNAERLPLSYWAGGLLLIAVALLYLLTLDNGLRPEELTGGDLITHQYAQVEARPSNAPGYPLYTMAGWLWFRLGRVLLGWAFNPIQILSLYSILWGLASLLILYLILLKVSRWSLALLLTAFYATTFFFWYYSVTTEQYTSAVFQTLLVIWLAFNWEEQPRDSILLWLAFISGTMLANMVTTLFILPPLLWLILSRPAREGLAGLAPINYLKKPRLIFQSIGLACLPLFSYLYVYLRGAQHPEWRGAGQWPSTGAWFWHFLTIPQGRAELSPGLTLHSFFTAEFPALMWQELTWPIFWGGLLGLACLGKRRAIFLYSTLLIYLIFCWLYRSGNWFQVIIPAYPLLIIGFTAGLNQLISFLENRRTHAPRTTFHTPRTTYHVSHTTYHVSHFILLALLLYRLTTHLPRANQRDLPTDTGLEPGWAILADHPNPPALISTDFAERVALQYLSSVWQAAPRIYPAEAGHFKPFPEVEQGHLSFYLSRRAAAAAPAATDLTSLRAQLGQVYPQAAGEQLIALWLAPRTQLPAQARPLDLHFGESLQLAGWEQPEMTPAASGDGTSRRPQANWQIALYWQTTQPLAEDYTISVRPLVGGQVLIAQGEALIQDHQPVWGLYPTHHWRPGELVRDLYTLSLPPEITPEAVQIIVYQATETGFENLAEQTITLMAAER